MVPEKTEFSDHELMMKIFDASKGDAIELSDFMGTLPTASTLTSGYVQERLNKLVKMGFLRKTGDTQYTPLEKEEYFTRKLSNYLTEEGYSVLEQLETSVKTPAVEPSRGAVISPKGRVQLPVSTWAYALLGVLGLLPLGFVGWLLWYDTLVWSKDVSLILFGSRKGEVLSLGIGLTLIHYLIIGLFLLLSGLILFLRGRKTRSTFRRGSPKTGI
jgi:hypothetical protein